MESRDLRGRFLQHGIAGAAFPPDAEPVGGASAFRCRDGRARRMPVAIGFRAPGIDARPLFGGRSGAAGAGPTKGGFRRGGDLRSGSFVG